MKLKWIYSLVLCLFSRNKNLEIPANITLKLTSKFSDFVQFFLISLVCSKYFVQYRSVSLITRQIFMLQVFGRISFVACGITREFGFLLNSPFSDVSKAKNQNCLYVICFQCNTSKESNFLLQVTVGSHLQMIYLAKSQQNICTH